MSGDPSRSRLYMIRGHSEGAAASRRHPSANDPDSCDARMNTTPGIEGNQGYTHPSRAYDDHQQSQAPSRYVSNSSMKCTEDAFSSASGLGFRQVEHQQCTFWPQHPYQGMNASSYQVQGHPQTRATSDDQYSAIGGQFNPPIDLSGLVQDQQGAWNTEENVQDSGGMISDENPLTSSYGVPPIAREEVRHHADYSNAHLSQLGSIDDQQQSMLMESLGRRPGYQEELARAMSDDPPHQVPYWSANNTNNMSVLAYAGDRDPAGFYPPPQQDCSGNGIVPGIVLSRPGDLEYWHLEPRASLPPVIQPPDRSDPQLLDRSTPSSSSVVIGDVLRCPHEGCKAMFKKSWSRGNLGRHMRSKHKDGGKIYPCKADGCASVFQRSDARLKHHRKRHQELVNEPLRPRKTSSSTGTGSACEYLGGSTYSNSLASPSGRQALDDFEMASSCDIDNESCHDSSSQAFS